VPTLILPDRKSNPDIEALYGAAVTLGWEALPSRYRLPDGHFPLSPVLYGDPLFCDLMAAQLGVRLLEPPDDFLVTLDPFWTRRQVSRSTLAAARKEVTRPRFVKPAADKSFPAKVYASGANLLGDDIAPGETPVLISDPVGALWAVAAGTVSETSHSSFLRPMLALEQTY
jgi:hypothetical protein